MKVNLKEFGIEAEGDLEGIAKHAMDSHEHNWQKKFNSKHKAKKEMLALKHKIKMEQQKNNPSIFNYFSKQKEKKEKLRKEKAEASTKNIVKIISIILFFIYGIFCISIFGQFYIVAFAIGLVQMVCVILSLLSAMNIMSLFENDYKVFLLISILLIIPWLAFITF